jgi:hypothetical protein
MSAATAPQIAAINNVIVQINTYQQQLSDGFDAAAAAGNIALAGQIHQRYTDAVALQVQAANLKNEATIGSLQAAADALKAQTDQLNAQASAINGIVNAVGVVATVLSTIGQIATAVAGLIAIL